MELFLYVCGALMTVCGTLTTVISLVNMMRSPKVKQDARIAELERRMAEHDDLFSKDNKRLLNIEEGNRVTQRALLSLLSHGIDGNSVPAMVKARDDLQQYLIER